VSIYYLSDSRDTAFAIDRKQLCAHFTRPAHADGKSSLDGVLPIPRSYLFLGAVASVTAGILLILLALPVGPIRSHYGAWDRWNSIGAVRRN
jgi:hypothetical protein